MAGTYDYLKVAKMKMDSSSSLVIDSSNVGLSSVIMTTTNLNVQNLNWDNAYDPTPGNDFLVNFPENPNVTASTLNVQGTSNFGIVDMNSLNSDLTTDVLVGTSGTVNGNLGITTLTDTTLTAPTLDCSGTTVFGTVVTDSLVTDNLVFGSMSTTSGLLIDTSGNVNVSNKINVSDNVLLSDNVYVESNVAINQNASITNNLSVLQNKYISNSVFVANNFQMWDGSGLLDPSGYIVNLNASQLQSLLNLI